MNKEIEIIRALNGIKYSLSYTYDGNKIVLEGNTEEMEKALLEYNPFFEIDKVSTSVLWINI